MGIKINWMALTLVATLAMQPCTAKEVTLELRPWPAVKTCTDCVALQFGVLHMRLPASVVGRIFVSGGDGSAVHLIAPGEMDARNSAVFLSTKRSAYVGKYKSIGLASADTMGAEAFFDVLGISAPEGSALAFIRRIESVRDAEHYVKTSKGLLHAYWIQATPDKSQYLHVVVDGSDTIYTVAGAISPQLYFVLLSGMSVEAEP